MKLPALNCGIPAAGPAGIIIQMNTMQAAGIRRSNQRGGVQRRRPVSGAVDFSEYASINGAWSSEEVVGQDARVVGMVLAEVNAVGSNGIGTAAPLPSRNDQVRSGVFVSVGRRSFSVVVAAPTSITCKVKVMAASRQAGKGRRGHAPVQCQ